jgi:hypothetical protein
LPVRFSPLLEDPAAFACHGDSPDGELKGDLDLTSREAMLKGRRIRRTLHSSTEKPDESLIYQAIRWDGYEMPPKENDRLSKAEIAYFESWITAGAPWPEAKRLAALQKESWEAEEGVVVETSGGESPDWTNRKYAEEDLWAYQPLSDPQVPKNSFPGSSDSAIDAFINREIAIGRNRSLRQSRQTRL